MACVGAWLVRSWYLYINSLTVPRPCKTLSEQDSPQLPLIVFLVRKLLVSSCVLPTEALWGSVEMTLHPRGVATPSASQPYSSGPSPGSKTQQRAHPCAEKGAKSTSLEEEEKVQVDAPHQGRRPPWGVGCYLIPGTSKAEHLCLSSSEPETANLAPRDERIRKHFKCPLFLLSTAKLQRTPNPGVFTVTPQINQIGLESHLQCFSFTQSHVRQGFGGVRGR